MLKKVFLLLLLIFIFLYPKNILAQACNQTGTDYQTYRPYPGDPCNPEFENQSLLCGNSMIIKKSFEKTPANGTCQTPVGQNYTCFYVETGHVEVEVDTSDSKLPIMGNSELSANKNNSEDKIDDVTKMNDFVNWYLNGTLNTAENPYPFYTVDLQKWLTGYYSQIINFSGPLRKLLPQDIQNVYRIKQITDAVKSKNAKSVEDFIRHDQVVGCTYSIKTPLWLVENAVNFVFNIFGKRINIPLANVGNFIGPCTNNILLSPFKTQHRLSEWLMTTNIFLENKLPPIMSKEKYPNPGDWWIAYERWRGKTCIVVPSWGVIPKFLRNLGFCIDNPLKPNYYADLFTNVPMSSTEDRKGLLTIDEPTDVSSEDFEVEVKNFKLIEASVLNFPHMQEVYELSQKLQLTFKPKEGTNNTTGPVEPVQIDPGCTILQVRSGDTPGDSLLPDSSALAEFDYVAKFSCTFSVNDLNPFCKKEMVLSSSINTQTPLADEIWNNLVVGNSAVVRRMFPKFGEGEIGNLVDFPTVTSAEYKTTSGNVTVTPTNAEIYFPHIGSLDEYFLKGIQTLLRPKGFGEPIYLSDNSNLSSGEINCDQNISNIQVPGLNKAEGKRISDIWYGAGVGKAFFEECNNDVIQRAISKGVSPIFALAIWIHESDSSNYEARTPVEDFGIHGSSSAPPNNFSAQLDAFLNLPDFYATKCPTKNLESFISMYWFGHCIPKNADEKTRLQRYIDELNFIYSVIAPGVTLPNYPK